MFASFPQTKLSVDAGKMDTVSFQPDWMAKTEGTKSKNTKSNRGETNIDEIQEMEGRLDDDFEDGIYIYVSIYAQYFYCVCMFIVHIFVKICICVYKYVMLMRYRKWKED
jgi:hypothetical protein